jgi:hypothetical protein
MRGPRLLTIFALVAGLAVAVPAPSASAGGYDVIACNQTVAGGANHSWTPVADPGMTAYTDCPAGQGIMVRNVYDGSASGFLQGAYMILDAPPGNSVDSISFEAGMRRPDCNWGAELVASNGDLAGNILFGLAAGQYCDSQFQTDENTYLGGRFNYAVGASRIRIEARCAAGSCTRNGVASFHMRNVDVRIGDNVAPVLSNGRGALWTSGGWLSGSQSIGFDASDAAGIQNATATVDGREIVHAGNVCDYTYVTPCPQASVSQPVPTAGFGGDGPHTLTLSAVDGAGNPSSVSRTVLIDNTPPDAPQALAVDGGDGWRPTNNFNINLTLAPVTSGAPVAGANWQVCPVGGGPCTPGSASATDLTPQNAELKFPAPGTYALPLKLPGPGAYTLKLWLRDAAGNQDSRLSAPPVTLAYDDASPTASFDAPDPNDPTLVAVDTTDRGSGVVSGTIQMRHRGGGNWLTLPTTVSDGRLLSHIDDERLGDGDYEFQATATDAAGNQRITTQRADGSPEIITLPLRLKIGMRSGVVVRTKHGAHLARAAYAKYGQLVRVRGRLRSPEGNPLQDVEVQAWTQIRDGVTPPRLIATVKTTKSGSFTFLVRKGPSRSIKIRYAGTAQIRGVTKNLSLSVRSVTSIRSNHKRVVNGEAIRLHGRIRTGRIPARGKLVEVQVFTRGKWRTFATARAGHAHGTWSYNYRFDGTRGLQTYRFRARVPLEDGYPFATGRSGVVRVRVRGT